LRDQSQLDEFIAGYIVQLAFGKSIQKHRSICGSKGNNHPITTRLARASTSKPELDEAAAQIRVDQSTLRPLDGFPQRFVRNVFASGKAREPSGFERSHTFA
jgi:hypothetical protein